MARLRFPGRPGHRFGRLGVRYGVDGARKNEDSSEILIANIHASLRKFHELFGESDEEEEFEGFTQDDIDQTSKRLISLETELGEQKRALAEMTVVNPKKYWPKGVQFLQSALKDGQAQPARTSMLSRVLEAERAHKTPVAAVPTRSPIKLKFKMDSKKANREKIRLKKMKEKAKLKTLKEKAKIKKLKEKEKKKMKAIKKKIKKLKRKEGKVEVTDEVVVTPVKPVAVKPLQAEPNSVAMGFVLPSQSVHSSRRIIPNKRLTDYDDGFSPIKRVKPPVVESAETLPLEQFKAPDAAAAKWEPVDGKRERKPSSRMVDMMCEDIVKKKIEKSSKNILQRAKFRLNRSAINKSKRALAKSLKRKMGAKGARTDDQPDLPSSPTLLSHESGMQTAFGKTPIDLQRSCLSKVGSAAKKEAVFGQSSLPAIPKYALKTTTDKLPSFNKPSRCCYVCKDPNQKYYFHFGSKHLSCRCCHRFYLAKSALVNSTGVRFVCNLEGKCEVDLKLKNASCVACRYKKTVECYGPPTEVNVREKMEEEAVVLQDTPMALDCAPDPGGTPPVGPESESSSPPPPLPSTDAVPSDREGNPRIKHVCRRASVALGRARFPGQMPQLRLSALPDQEKLLQLQANDSSDSDDMSLAEIIQHAPEKAEMASVTRKIRPEYLHEDRDGDSDFNSKKSANSLGGFKRTVRCRNCTGCREQECQQCIFCLDMPKYGGSGRMKKACIRRVCQHPVKKSKNKVRKKQGLPKTADSEDSAEIFSEGDSETDTGSEDEFTPSPYVRPVANKISPMKTPHDDVKIVEKKSMTGRRIFTKVNVPSARRTMRSKFQGVEGKETPKPLVDVDHRLKLEFNGELSIEAAWQHGVALVSSNSLCVRAVCYLCGSGGHNQLIYCSVCCEPFHSFCLDKGERPLADNLENWCCRKCQFCRVCGKGSNNLLQCIQCQDAYHPSQSCLQKYPNKPSKNRRIWVCPKCVKCKSCGATSPGDSSDATWMYDFSLCNSCGLLMSKGNFCPVCHKCYADDDWDSKMMQCSTCESWVHAKCEGLTDEMYSIMSYLPEDVQYHCPRCSNVRPAPWMRVIKQEMATGMLMIINAMIKGRKVEKEKEEEVKEEVVVEEEKLPPLVAEVKLNSALDDIISSATTPEKVAPIEVKVNDSEVDVPRDLKVKVNDSEADLPRDLKMIQRKQKEGRYVTVNDFVDDVARILQLDADPSNAWLKINSIIRSIFQKHLKFCFPWFNIKNSKFWSNRLAPLPDGMLPDAVLPPSDDHTYHQWLQREAPPLSPQPSVYKSPRKAAASSKEQEDSRVCALCAVLGDCPPGDQGRLLYAGADDWVHINCGLWSAETYENDDGVLVNIHTAINRGRKLKCDACSKPGPTVGCCHVSCSANFHFMCARKAECSFQYDKRVFCRLHWYACTDECIRDNKFSVSRRSCLKAFSNKWLKNKSMQKGLLPRQVNLLCGSLTVDNLGEVTLLSDGPRYLSPVDFCSSRVYWSTQDARRRCVYTFRITEVKPVLPPEAQVFTRNLTISHDRTHPDYDAELERNFRTMLSPGGAPGKRPADEAFAPCEPKLSDVPPSPVVDIKEEIRQLVKSYGQHQAEIERATMSRTQLSENTIKLLGGHNALRMLNKPQTIETPESGCLTAIAQRLNAAAAKNKSSREGSRRSSVEERRDFALSTDGLNDDVPKKKQRASTVIEPETKCKKLSIENLSSEAKSVLNGTPDSHSDAELSSSDYSDTDIDLHENYGDPDETSCDSDVRIIPCSVSLTRVEDMPLHAKLAEKIKAKSLAHSAPSEEGPFKCDKCKRLYRTHESWRVHDETCDFVVTSSEDESEQEDTPKRSILNNNSLPLNEATDEDDDIIVVDESPEAKVTNLVIDPVTPEKEEIFINIGPSPAKEDDPVPVVIPDSTPRLVPKNIPVCVNPADLKSDSSKTVTNVKLPDGTTVKVILSPEHLKRLDISELPNLLQKSASRLSLTSSRPLTTSRPLIAARPPPPRFLTPVRPALQPAPQPAHPVISLVNSAPIVTQTPHGPITYVMPQPQSQPRPLTSIISPPVHIMQKPQVNRVTVRKPTMFPRKAEKNAITVATAMQPKGLPSVKFTQSMKRGPSDQLQCMPLTQRPPTSMPVKRKYLVKKVQDNIKVKAIKTQMKAMKPPVKIKKDNKKAVRKSAPLSAEPTLPVDSSPHPLIHTQHQHPILPAPVTEEEVTDSPMTAVSQPPEAPAPKGGASPHLIYEITSDDGFSIKSQSIEDAWQKLVDSIQEARSNARMKQLSYSALSGADLFGLTNATVMYLIEQLYGAHKCKQYFFRYICYTHDDDDIEPDINPSGSARSEGFSSRKPFEMFSFLLSKYRPFPKTSAKVDRLLPQLGSSRRMPSQDLPMAMRFRYLKEDARDNVVVYRSLIHGRGLFSIRDFDVGEMIIEYAGMVIRSSLTDSREKYYETKGIGCYMFRIDDHFVIDATVNGNAARFINHSCDPNCFSRVIDVSGVKHIIIFALKAVKAGEELTYDYKFPYEDVKIPCTCQAKRCRKYLN